MDGSVFPERLATLRQKLNDMEAAWIIQPENRRYLSGFEAEDTQFTESSGSLLIGPSHCLLVTDSRYTEEAKREAVAFEVHTLKEGLTEELPELVSRLGIKTLGFEEEYVTWGRHRQLAERLQDLSPPVRLVPLNGLIEEMREVKDASEITALEAAADLMSAILDEVIPGLEVGVTEKSVAWQIEGLAREQGAESLAFPSIVASGPNGALPHAVPTDRTLREGEPIVLDVGVRLDGYRSDMTRTVFLGEPEPEFKEIYRTVRRAQLAALDEVRPGVESTHPDAVARQIIRDAGFGSYFGHSLGHGVGLAAHERPRLGPRKPVPLKEKMVVTVEPGIYIPGKGGVRLEEMVVIQKDAPRVITRNSKFYDFD